MISGPPRRGPPPPSAKPWKPGAARGLERHDLPEERLIRGAHSLPWPHSGRWLRCRLTRAGRGGYGLGQGTHAIACGELCGAPAREDRASESAGHPSRDGARNRAANAGVYCAAIRTISVSPTLVRVKAKAYVEPGNSAC